MLDPVSLRLFISVVEERTIAAAATREHIAAAAVSKRISELEGLLKTPLLIRSNKGIVPTAAGISLLYMARAVLNKLDDIALQMREFSRGRRGSVHILANISAITQFLPPLFKSFLDLYPDVQINLQESESLSITKAISENVADIGIFTVLPHGAEIEVYPFRTDELVVIVPAVHPLAEREAVTFAEALDYEFVSLQSGTHLYFRMIEAAAEAGRPLRLRMQVSGYDALCLMVGAGMGIGILPKMSASIYSMEHAKILTLVEPWAHRELALCVRSREALSVTAGIMFEHLIENAGTHPAEI